MKILAKRCLTPFIARSFPCSVSHFVFFSPRCSSAGRHFYSVWPIWPNLVSGGQLEANAGKLGQICSSPAEIPPLMLPRCGCGVRGCRWAERGEGCHLELFVGTIRISHRPAQPPRSMATCLQCCQGGQIAKLLCSLIEGKPFAWA